MLALDTTVLTLTEKWIQFVLSGFSVPFSTDFSHLCEGHCPLQSDMVWVIDGDNNVHL